MKKLSTCLWFNTEAEEAAKFYTSVFKNGKMGKITRYTKEGFEVHGKAAGTVLTVAFEIEGETFLALNGGPNFKFNESISFIIMCDTQKEIDHYWEKLTSGGGQEVQCGWLKDKYGVSWQVTPKILDELLNGPKAEKVMKVLLQMKKLDIEAFKKAAS